jgi:hypothetical protein
MNWKSERRKNIAIVLITYVAILIITTLYFVPELLSITRTEYSDAIDANLKKRADLWETLSLVRLGVLLVLSVVLNLGLTKKD